MKILLTYRERLAGLFVVLTLALVVAFFVGAGLRNRWLASRTVFHTLVRQGDGLRTGSPILLSGIEVGEVGELVIQDDNRIDVELLVLTRHAHRLRTGARADVRRVLGIGEKRVHLGTDDKPGSVLAAGSMLPSREPLDMLDLMAELDLGTYVRTMDRALAAMERVLGKLEEGERFERMVVAFDRMGPTLEKVDLLLGELHKPMVALVKNPALRGTLAGANSLLNDPATKKAVREAAKALEPARVDNLIAHLDALIEPSAPLPRVLAGADRMLNDGRADRLVSSLDRLSDEKRMGRILDNVSILAEQTSKIGPEIPHITRELTATLREAVIVLRALQKTWLLEGKSEEAREELGKGRK